MKRTLWIGLSLVLLVLLAAGTFFGYRYYDSTTNYVSTENAHVMSQTVPVGSMNAGQVASLRVDVGSQVEKGQVLAQIELPTLVRTLQNGTPELVFLGAVDQRVDVVAPMNGLVVAVQSAVGQTVGQGQPLVSLMDPSRVWITANVDENRIAKIRVGQAVEARVAAAGKTFGGRVRAITPATASSFLAIPAANATGDYTNPGQLVPIKIEVDHADTVLYTGATAQVKIRVS
jgi:multidrug resistance efflux pump